MEKQDPWYSRTEFWKSSVVLACGAFAFVFGLIKGNMAATAIGGGMMGVGSLGYSVSRGLAKSPTTDPSA